MSLLRHSAQYYFVISQLRFQFGYSRFNEGGSTPVLFPSANVDYKIFSGAGFRLRCGTLPGGTVLPILLFLYLISSDGYFIC